MTSLLHKYRTLYCSSVMFYILIDFQDTSPEELRHLAYEAQKSNSFQGYVSTLFRMLYTLMCLL